MIWLGWDVKDQFYLTLLHITKTIKFSPFCRHLNHNCQVGVLNIHFRSPSTHKMSPWVKNMFTVVMPRILLMKRPLYAPKWVCECLPFKTLAKNWKKQLTCPKFWTPPTDISCCNLMLPIFAFVKTNCSCAKTLLLSKHEKDDASQVQHRVWRPSQADHKCNRSSGQQYQGNPVSSNALFNSPEHGSCQNIH